MQILFEEILYSLSSIAHSVADSIEDPTDGVHSTRSHAADGSHCARSEVTNATCNAGDSTNGPAGGVSDSSGGVCGAARDRIRVNAGHSASHSAADGTGGVAHGTSSVRSTASDGIACTIKGARMGRVHQPAPDRCASDSPSGQRCSTPPATTAHSTTLLHHHLLLL